VKGALAVGIVNAEEPGLLLVRRITAKATPTPCASGKAVSPSVKPSPGDRDDVHPNPPTGNPVATTLSASTGRPPRANEQRHAAAHTNPHHPSPRRVLASPNLHHCSREVERPLHKHSGPN
jgi:hypothetical protein